MRLEAARGAPGVLAFHLVHIFKNHRAHIGQKKQPFFLSYVVIFYVIYTAELRQHAPN